MEKLTDTFTEFIQDPERRRLFEREDLAFSAAELISLLMEHGDVSKAKLAELLNTPKSNITNLLSGSRNMTLHSLADMAFALGHKVELQPVPLSATWAFGRMSKRPRSEAYEPIASDRKTSKRVRKDPFQMEGWCPQAA
jgi:antitoxin component HigA of HigAB toxin-antitoxin module